MPSFEIETYTIFCSEEGKKVGFSKDEHRIYVESPIQHGIRYRAALEFGDKPQAWENIGVALNVGRSNFDGISMIIYMPPARYLGVYEYLLNGKPARLFYTLLDIPHNPGSSTKYIDEAAVLTCGREPEKAGSNQKAKSGQLKSSRASTREFDISSLKTTRASAANCLIQMP
jgi:hypothetical protein